MKVLVACHCKEPVMLSDGIKIGNYSPNLAFIKNPFGKNPITNPPDIELYYVEVDHLCKSYDSEYQYKGWENIPEDSFDLIWYEFCPLFTLKKEEIVIDDEIFTDILTSSLSVLKPGGMIMTSLSKEKKNRLAGQFIQTNFKQVNHKFVESSNIPYCMVEKDIDNIPNDDRLQAILDNYMLIITKKQNNEKPKGGKKSKSKKSTKSKKQKKSTKSNRSNIKK